MTWTRSVPMAVRLALVAATGIAAGAVAAPTAGFAILPNPGGGGCNLQARTVTTNDQNYYSAIGQVFVVYNSCHYPIRARVTCTHESAQYGGAIYAASDPPSWRECHEPDQGDVVSSVIAQYEAAGVWYNVPK